VSKPWFFHFCLDSTLDTMKNSENAMNQGIRALFTNF